MAFVLAPSFGLGQPGLSRDSRMETKGQEHSVPVHVSFVALSHSVVLSFKIRNKNRFFLSTWKDGIKI